MSGKIKTIPIGGYHWYKSPSTEQYFMQGFIRGCLETFRKYDPKKGCGYPLVRRELYLNGSKLGTLEGID